LNNEELLTIAHAILIRCKQTGQDCIEIERAVNAINHLLETNQTDYIGFSYAVLAAEIEDFENNNKSAF
jgi:hypothetical protein